MGGPVNLKTESSSLDPEKVTERDIREVLSKTSAPRILNINGGIILVYTRMISFSKFLIGMGYPGAKSYQCGGRHLHYELLCKQPEDCGHCWLVL